MISSLAWVPKGAPRQQPVRYEVSQAELLRIKSNAKDKKVINSENKAISTDEKDEDELPKELRMDEYDDDNYDDIDSEDDNNDIGAYLNKFRNMITMLSKILWNGIYFIFLTS